MCAELAAATGADFCGLVRLVRSDPRAFDSLWYAAFPPEAACDVDAILGR